MKRDLSAPARPGEPCSEREPTRPPNSLLQWAAFAYLLTGLCSCRHAYQHQESAAKKEIISEKWKIDARAEQQKHETASTTKRRHRVRETFRPDGTLSSRTTTTTASAGTWSNVASGSSSRSAAGVADRTTTASSSSSTRSSTSWWPPLWMWLAGIALILAVLWVLRWRARRMRLV